MGAGAHPQGLGRHGERRAFITRPAKDPLILFVVFQVFLLLAGQTGPVGAGSAPCGAGSAALFLSTLFVVFVWTLRPFLAVCAAICLGWMIQKQTHRVQKVNPFVSTYQDPRKEVGFKTCQSFPSVQRSPSLFAGSSRRPDPGRSTGRLCSSERPATRWKSLLTSRRKPRSWRAH